jgi:uncharacterized membrane protein YbhN (UPF0104 family)
MQANTRRRWSVALATIIVVAAAAGLVRVLSANWTEVRRAVRAADWALLAAGLLAAMLAMALVAQRWHATLRTLGAQASLPDAVRWFMTGQMGKYAPGGVLQVVGQGELAARGGVARRAAYASVILSTVVLVGGAALVVAGGAVLPSTTTPWWAVGIGAAICAVFLEPHLRRTLLTKAGVHESSGGLAPRRLVGLVVGGVPAWLAVGAATWLVARAFSPQIGIAPIVVAAVASWLVGIVTLPAPGGIGVREAVLAAALRDDLGSGTAALVALTARMVFLAADLGWFLLARFLPVAPPAAEAAADPALLSEGEPQP